jgi:hypothetical protein
MSPSLPDFVDERFLLHRLRSSSTAGVACAAAAVLLFAYRYYSDQVVSKDLAAVALVFIIVKYALFLWYRRTD